MKNISKLLIVSIMLILFTNTWVNATTVIDQQQPVIDTSTGTTLAIGGNSHQNLAQVVTAGISGVLTEVRFPVACGSGNLVIEVQGVIGDIPDGIVLTSQTITGSSLPTFTSPEAESFRSLIFSTPVFFSAGSRFALVLSSAGQCSVSKGPAGDSYLGGNAFFDARPNPLGVWVCMCDFVGASFDLPFQTLVEDILPASIDIKPGSLPNSINQESKGKVPVAILSSPTFDAPNVVDQITLSFGREGNEPSLAFCNNTPEDANGDGFQDLVCHFYTQATGFLLGDTQGVLKGKTLSGISIKGTDSVRIVH